MSQSLSFGPYPYSKVELQYREVVPTHSVDVRLWDSIFALFPPVRIVTRIVYSRCKYKPKHFKQVDRLCVKGRMKQYAALTEVAEKNGFNLEGFSKQYRVRHLNRKQKVKSPS